MPPESARSQLATAALELEVALSEAQVDTLLGHLSLLEKWNKVYNLTSVRDPAAMLVQHLVDSLSVVPPLTRHLGTASGAGYRLLDVGSGAGLPGVVLAIALPDLMVTCVETVGKKASFIRQAAAELGLRRLHVEQARVEAMAAGPFDVITSRAFAALSDFVRLTRTQLAPGACWMAMKARPPVDEIAALPSDVEVFHVEHLRVPGLDAERCLVWMRSRLPLRSGSTGQSNATRGPAAPADLGALTRRFAGFPCPSRGDSGEAGSTSPRYRTPAA